MGKRSLTYFLPERSGRLAARVRADSLVVLYRTKSTHKKYACLSHQKSLPSSFSSPGSHRSKENPQQPPAAQDNQTIVVIRSHGPQRRTTFSILSRTFYCRMMLRMQHLREIIDFSMSQLRPTAFPRISALL